MLMCKCYQNCNSHFGCFLEHVTKDLGKETNGHKLIKRIGYFIALSHLYVSIDLQRSRRITAQYHLETRKLSSKCYCKHSLTQIYRQ